MPLSTNGVPLVASYPPFYKAGGWERVYTDTYLASGAYPQELALTAFDFAAIGAAIAGNASTESANAVTSNVSQGLITTASQSLAVGATYVITLTNSAILTTSVIRAAVYNKSNVVPGAYIVSIGTPASGSVVITLGNANLAGTALSGTLFVPFLVATQ